MLVELPVVEQRYRAVLLVLAGATVTEVAAEVGVSRQTLHVWKARYAESGLAGLADRSRRPWSCPHQALWWVDAYHPHRHETSGDGACRVTRAPDPQVTAGDDSTREGP